MSLFFLRLQIAIERRQMEDMARIYGRGDERVLRQSQEVDRLINELQRRLAG